MIPYSARGERHATSMRRLSLSHNCESLRNGKGCGERQHGMCWSTISRLSRRCSWGSKKQAIHLGSKNVRALTLTG